MSDARRRPARSLILGAGVTGLAAARATGFPVFEASDAPGGICRSYYVRPGTRARLNRAPAGGNAYRFEFGGGHWIFGGDARVLEFIESLTPVRRYGRRSSVYFPAEKRYVPYPIQNNLRRLGAARARTILRELSGPRRTRRVRTLRQWLGAHFGPTLCRLFFHPFNRLYTAGLDRAVAPQDAYKSPVDLAAIRAGARGEPPAAGYNVTYLYPRKGLDVLARRLAAPCEVRYGKRAVRIDARAKLVRFSDGSRVAYDSLLSTLPLNRLVELTGVKLSTRPDPFTSVLVLNVGAVRGPNCPEDHWLYLPGTRSGFHRVGFYHNVDRSFLPRGRAGEGRASLYVERAYANGEKPSRAAADRFVREALRELKDWGFIGEVEAADATWIDVAYTWEFPGSRWKEEAIGKLDALGIHSIGRYGRWTFQGIAESMKEGLSAGRA
ncbi:MAG TPA: FAD-dependent oxidoreductase [Candidatus Eisenbacteria bacterium]|nr:FAD-dependent oxidoreductase [Candidatus Eisenbacteria bacterium]